MYLSQTKPSRRSLSALSTLSARSIRSTLASAALASALLVPACGPPASTAPPAQSLVRFPYDAFPTPLDNQPSAERTELGRLLFFDPILSANKKVSCGSCHHPDHAMADGLPVGAALGDPAGGELPRSSPTIFNVRFQHFQQCRA